MVFKINEASIDPVDEMDVGELRAVIGREEKPVPEGAEKDVQYKERLKEVSCMGMIAPDGWRRICVLCHYCNVLCRVKAFWCMHGGSESCMNALMYLASCSASIRMKYHVVGIMLLLPFTLLPPLSIHSK